MKTKIETVFEIQFWNSYTAHHCGFYMHYFQDQERQKKEMLGNDAMKNQGWRLNSWQTIKQGFFITEPGTRGISPPNMCTKHTVISG